MVLDSVYLLFLDFLGISQVLSFSLTGSINLFREGFKYRMNYQANLLLEMFKMLLLFYNKKFCTAGK